MRLAKIEKKQAGDDRVRGLFVPLTGLLVSGMVAAVIMLVTTSSTVSSNTERIERIDDRQRTMQMEQAEHGGTLQRIETLLTPDRRAAP